MRARGVEVEYIVKDNEGHGFRNEENRFEFYDAQQPASIDPSEFTFTPPAGTNSSH